MSEDIWATPLYLTRLAHEGKLPTSLDVERLAEFLDFRTTASAGTDPDKRFQASSHRGYLETVIGGDRVFVPYHLAVVFPGEEIFNSIHGIARAIALRPKNPICVSGSATFLGTLRTIGDLDFSEYHLEDPKALIDALQKKSAAGPPIALVEVKCAKKSFTHPWDNLSKEIEAVLFSSVVHAPANRMKLDFISVSNLGVLPTTSVVLPLAADPEAGNASHSFAYQEAVIASAGPPRALHSVESFAVYSTWLLNEARVLISESDERSAPKEAAKALKRLLSFLLLIGYAKRVEEVLTALGDSAIEEIVLEGRRVELNAMMDRVGERPKVWLADRLSTATAVRSTALDQDQLDEVVVQTWEIARLVLAEIDLLIEDVGGSA